MSEKGRYCYDYPRPMVVVDMVVFCGRGDQRSVLLIRRGREPFKGMWATPGGFVDMDEPLGTAAARELEEETGLRDVALTQYGVFGRPCRDPRGRVISIAYYGTIDPHQRQAVRHGDDAAAVQWFPVTALPPLACDHDEVIAGAIQAAGAERGGPGGRDN